MIDQTKCLGWYGVFPSIHTNLLFMLVYRYFQDVFFYYIIYYKLSKRNDLKDVAYKDEELSEEKVFKVPVHKYVHVTDRVIWDLIATPEFQRLRRIKQLGTTNLTFHGGEHSRFNHSLGVYEIVRRIIYNF